MESTEFLNISKKINLITTVTVIIFGLVGNFITILVLVEAGGAGVTGVVVVTAAAGVAGVVGAVEGGIDKRRARHPLLVIQLNLFIL